MKGEWEVKPDGARIVDLFQMETGSHWKACVRGWHRGDTTTTKYMAHHRHLRNIP